MHDDYRSNSGDEFSNFHLRPNGQARYYPSSNSQSNAGAPYNETKHWQTHSNRSSFGNMATQETTSEHTDQIMANFLDAATSVQSSVHGCMLRCFEQDIPVQTIPIHPSSSWQGTSATWDLITNLPLNDSVDVVKLLNKYLCFQSYSEDDHMYRLASLIFKYEGEQFALSQIAPWIIGKKCILQQNLQIINNHDIIPDNAKPLMQKALQIAGEMLTAWLFTQNTEDDDSEDDDLAMNGFSNHYKNDILLQTHLSSSSESDEDDNTIDYYNKMDLIQPSIFVQDKVRNAQELQHDHLPLFVQEDTVSDDQVNTDQSNISVQDNLIFDNEVEQKQSSPSDTADMLNSNFLNSINDDQIEYKHGMAIMVDSSILTSKNYNGIIPLIGNPIEQQLICTTAFMKSPMLIFEQKPKNEFRLFKQILLSQG
jgi:hypothetical protein